MQLEPETFEVILCLVEDEILEQLDGPHRYPSQPWMGGEYAVGWSQPPHPIDVIPSFNPRASKRDQARAVLLDYYHDDPLRYWSDNEAVKKCFGAKTKEDHDPTFLIAAYENKNHQVWKCGGTGMSWGDMDNAVQQAIGHRKKLGPLPRSSYDTDPIVIYYYDNDKMKRITYPRLSIPPALNPNNVWWWKWGQGDSSDAGKAAGRDDVHTRETDDSKKIAAERAHPGWVTKAQKQQLKAKYPWLSDMDSGSAGDWGSEGVTWDKDMIGVIGTIVGTLLELVATVLDATGVGAVIGVPLNILTPFIAAAINAVDAGMHAGDFGAALQSLGPALIQATAQVASKSGMPPAAVQALGTVVTAIGKAVSAGQAQKLSFGDLWNQVAAKAKSFGKLGDDEAHTIALMLGGKDGNDPARKFFLEGYEAGKIADPKTMESIAAILQSMASFADPRVMNTFLLGAGIGAIAKRQGVSQNRYSHTSNRAASRPAPHSAAHPATHHAGAEWLGQAIMESNPNDSLELFAHALLARYAGSRHMAGFSCPPGWDLVASDHQIACAFHGRAPCFGGFTDASGHFVCSDWDFPACPPGMATSPGSPKNWCLPVGGHLTGSDPQDWSGLGRGCPVGYWWDSLTGTCRPVVPLSPLPGLSRTSWEGL
jgi:hypothetical protein